MDNTFDKIFYEEGSLIGGVDESGVSDIAGPLVAACVILPKMLTNVRKYNLKIFEVMDCKEVPERYRKGYAEVIWETATAIGIGEVSPSEVDYLGKEEATKLAMVRAVIACKTTSKAKPKQPDFLIVDGERPVPVKIKQIAILNADKKSLCVASASIIAKVYRDEIMIRLHEKFPQYDWISNKGYPCENQFTGIDKNGIQIGIHRTKRWPFIHNERFAENANKWIERRKKWRLKTTKSLVNDIEEGLWTTKPRLLKLSKNCKKQLQTEVKYGKGTKPSKKEPRERKKSTT